MIQSVHLHNYGPIENLAWSNIGPINVVISPNALGKTFLLKALYTAIKTLEMYRRGNEQDSLSTILAHKLSRTFQCDKIGDLVTKGAAGSLSFSMKYNDQAFTYQFDNSKRLKIAAMESTIEPRVSNSIFLPAREVLSLQNIILHTREVDKAFGFDETYYDLAQALTQRGSTDKFAEARDKLQNLIGGRFELDDQSGRWVFRDDKQRFSIGTTAESVKKIGILGLLLNNSYLDTNSIIFIDEPEAALHPTTLSKLMEIIVLLSTQGIQFFLATHSYSVLKKLSLLCQTHSMSVPIITNEGDTWVQYDLLDGIPNNSIIDESIRLYEEEVDLALS